METFRHGGNITRLARMSGSSNTHVADFSANINPSASRLIGLGQRRASSIRSFTILIRIPRNWLML